MLFMKNKVLSAISAVLFVIASMVASSASFFIFYQPKTPKALKITSLRTTSWRRELFRG